MNIRFEKVSLIGVGLLGASLGLALKARGMAKQVCGIGRSQASLDIALRRGAIDEAAPGIEPGCADADLVVLCTPASSVLPLIEQVCRVSPDIVTTDVASTKEMICSHAKRVWPAPRHFAGSHPMAGSEKYGPENARDDLYTDSVVVVEPWDGHHTEAHKTVVALWESLGAKVVMPTPRQHDRIVSLVSHAPHVMAACLALAAAEDNGSHLLAGSGFRDTTRVAAGRAELWRDICLTNQTEVLTALDTVSKHINTFQQLIRLGDSEKLEQFFQKACDARQRVSGK